MRLLIALLTVFTAGHASGADDVATLADSTGYVVVERGGKTYRTAIGLPFYQGDTVKTGSTGKARLLMKDNSVLSIGPSSRLTLQEMKTVDNDRSFFIDVLVGRFKMDIAKWFRGDTKGRIETPTAIAGVRGTVVWGDTELDAVCALEGSISLESKNGGRGTEASDGDCYTGMKDGKTQAIEPSKEDLLKFLDQVTIK